MRWLDTERNTAALIQRCYDRLPRHPTAEQLHALCRLTWITKTQDGDVTADTTRAVVAPAMSAIVGRSVLARTRKDLVTELRADGVPDGILKCLSRPVGFVNLYGGFRPGSLRWIRARRSAVAQLFARARALRSDRDAEAIYAAIERLPGIPRRGGSPMHAFNLLTPVIACLDPRERCPIINGLDYVKAKLRRLGLANASLVEQFRGLVRQLNQHGITGALELDTMEPDELVAAATRLGKTGRPKTHRRVRRRLSPRSESDVEVLRKSLTVTHRQLHNKMTNALLKICKRAGITVEQGTESESLFDALLRSYRKDERHLLLEVKTSDAPGFCRLAVGQLLDYRRGLPERAATDLGVLLPARPGPHAGAFLREVGVKVAWLSHDMMRIEGDVRIG